MDRSLKMLNKAASRLKKLNGKIPENIFLLQADIFLLPFYENTFSVVNSHGMLHLFSNIGNYLNSLNKVLQKNGKMFFLVILGENILGKIFTRLALALGEFGFSMNGKQLAETIEKLGYKTSFQTIGNIGYFELVNY